MKKKLILTAVVLTYIIIGCSGDISSVDADGSGAIQESPDTGTTCYPDEIQFIEGTSWKLSYIVDEVLGVVTHAPTSHANTILNPYTLEFGVDSTFRTFSSVNTFFGKYIVLSRRACGEYSIYMVQYIGTKVYAEEDFVGDNLWREAFPTIKRFVLQGDELKLFYNDNKNSLVFKSL
jgi:hypothetical protein